MYASGSKNTSQFQQESKRLNMRTSKQILRWQIQVLDDEVFM